MGTALLVALLAISGTADSRVVSQLGRGGPIAAIHVDDSFPAANALDSDSLQTAGHHDIDARAVAGLGRAPHVSAVVPVLTVGTLAIPCPAAEPGDEGAACQHRPRPYGAGLVGTDLRHADRLPVTLVAGRLPRPGAMQEVAVTQSYLDHLQLGTQHPRLVLGTFVEFGTARALGEAASPQFQSRWFFDQVVGVVAQSVEDGDFLVPIEQTAAARAFALTGTVTPGFLGGIGSPYSALVVVADSLADVHAVRERWREIGVMKAIGAEDADVWRWFLVEGVGIGAIGGVIGTAVGMAIAWTVGLVVNQYLTSQGLEGVDLTEVPVLLAVAAPTGVAVLAMAAAALPALRAARLPARDALGGL